MKVVEMAEFLSAFAAFMTVCLAIAELASRSKAKKADVAIELYADYLYVTQQLEYIIGSVDAFARKCAEITACEKLAYAKTHMIAPSLFTMIQKIESESICNFNYSSEEGKRNSKEILDFTGAAINLLVYVNTFYQTILDNEDYPVESIQKNHRGIETKYKDLLPIIHSTNSLLNKNLKKIHMSSNAYLISLCLAGLVFFALCFVLRLI